MTDRLGYLKLFLPKKLNFYLIRHVPFFCERSVIEHDRHVLIAHCGEIDRDTPRGQGRVRVRANIEIPAWLQTICAVTAKDATRTHKPFDVKYVLSVPAMGNSSAIDSVAVFVSFRK